MNQPPISYVVALYVACALGLPRRTHGQEAPAAAEPPAAPDYGAVATASRLARPIHTVPAPVTVITRREIELSPSLTTDGLLRTVPSVAVFRRSSSLSADPSSQGLNLRGIGPSGVSRTLVLLDGVPVNDPFGGSIYFRALPRLGIQRVEVVPGGGSALYGSSALSGVVQLFSRTQSGVSVDGDASYGLANTVQLAGRTAAGNDQARASLEAEWLHSDGFRVISEGDRGAIDQPAASGSGNLIGRGDVAFGKRWSLTPSLSFFRQELRGATQYTDATVELGTAAVRTRYDGRAHGQLDLLVFGRLASFEQTRTRVLDERANEALAARQHVPAADQGGSLSWASKNMGSAQGHVVLAGLDARHVSGMARERLYPAMTVPNAPRTRQAGGQQWLLGAFVQDLVRVRHWFEFDGALRVDFYQNYRGFQRVQTFEEDATKRVFSRRDQWAVNPRIGALLAAAEWLHFRASAYRSFRAPTLNELYRPFQVGTVLTAANAALKPELLTGAELGVETIHWDALTLRANGFWNALENPVSNATLAEPLEDGSTRIRRNLKLARVCGAEVSADIRLARRWSALLAYTFVDARVVKSGPVADVTGKRLAQDPAHRASFLLFFDDPNILSVSLQVRALGAQYEDDLNTLRMGAYGLVDAFIARRLGWGFEAFIAVENMLNQSYLVGRAGVDTVGTPLLARVGIRLRQRLLDSNTKKGLP